MPRIYLALLHSLGFSQRRLRDVDIDDVRHVYESVDVAFLQQIGLNIDTAIRIVDKKSTLHVEHVEDTLSSLQISIIHRDDENFPSLLKNLPDCPTLLYVRGKLPTNEALISVVGSRKHSQYSVSCLEKILPDLIKQGYGIISGGAYGIDSIAHSVALKNGGYTAAVFGSGVDLMYPPSNTKLFENILASGGGLISQFPLGTKAEPFNFPIRNAIVAGISRGTLIAEAGEDSGTLITARLAVEANREVFVIPADITRESARGSNALIRDGLGKLVMTAEDILSEYQIVDRQMSLLSTLKPTFDDEIQEKLYEILCLDRHDVDTLCEKLDMGLPQVMSALAMMEMEGLIESKGGVYSVK